MKKLVTVFIIILSFKATAQTYILSENVVKSFKNFNKQDARRLVVTDDLSGGDFNLYFGADQVDNGIIFIDAISRKWKRVQIDNKINIKWYGAIGTENTPNDAYLPIVAARDYCYSHKGSILYIPHAGGTYGYYYVSKTINFAEHDISIEGENFGASHSTNSILKFPGNITGFDFNMKVNIARFVTIKNLSLRGGGNEAGTSYKTWDITKHGIQINTNFLIENVYIANFSGNGFHVTGGGGLGSTNRSVFKNCEGDYCHNGFFISGTDANTILFDNCSGVQNKRWGFLDKSFLGNTYNNCHVATNALLEITQDDYVKAAYGGNTYVAINLDEVNNTGFRPDLHPDKWRKFNEQGQQKVPWVSTRRYYSGGAYCSTLDNASHVYTNCYSEGFEPPSRFASRTLVLNGLQEAGSDGGAKIFANFGAVVNQSEVNFNSKATFGNIYGTTASIQANITGLISADRYLDIRGDQYSTVPNIRAFGDGMTKIFTDFESGFKPALWVHNMNTAQLGGKPSLVVSQGGILHFSTAPILDVRSGTNSYEGGLSRFTVYGDGKIKFGGYTSANSYKGISTASLQIDEKGNVITGPVVGNTMTKKQRDAIVSPAQGLLIFVTDNGGYLSWYNAGWQKIASVKD